MIGVKTFKAVMIGLGGFVLVSCSGGPQDVFTEAEIAEMREDIQEAVTIAQSTRGDGKPAMWTLGDEDTTIHIFGTIHILPPGLDWRSDKFNAAFAAADTLVMETVDGDPDEEAALMAKMMANAMYSNGETLKDYLSEADYERVSAAAQNIGVPSVSMAQMKPWLAAVTMELALAFEQGYTEEAGVEVVLEKEALAAGKSLGALETSEFQLSLFDEMSENAQLEYLVSSAVTIDMAREVYDVDLQEWLDGDVAGQSAFMDPDIMGTSDASDEFIDLLIRGRNEAWIPQIEALLEDPGTVMIAVGAGHLAGPDSVILMLREKGYTVEGP